MALRFRLGSIPVSVQLWFLALPLLFSISEGLAAALAWVLVVFVSVLAHELGHALMMKAYGFAPAIELHGMGGHTRYPTGGRPTAKQSLFITLAGPLTGLALALVLGLFLFFVPLDRTTLVWKFLAIAAQVNVFWSLVNLLPVLPWDGGLILEALLELTTRRPRPRAVAAVSMLIGAGLLAYAIAIGRQGSSSAIFIGYFGVMGMFVGWQRWSTGPAVVAQQEAWRLIHDGRAEEAAQMLETLTREMTQGPVRAALTETMAWAKLHARDVAGAQVAVAQMGEFPPSPELAARLAAARGNARTVVETLWPLVSLGGLSLQALPLLSSALLELGRVDDVTRLGLGMTEKTPEAAERLLSLSEVLFRAEAFEACLTVCRHAFGALHQGIFAFNSACALVRLGKMDDAVQALSQAVGAGYLKRDSFLKDPDLEPLRRLPAFEALVAKLP